MLHHSRAFRFRRLRPRDTL